MKHLPKYTRLAAGLLLLYSLASCTYDYFVDENNCWISVPQIQNSSIQDFYIAFHDELGGHMRSSHIYAPFDKNGLMQDGSLRFKLKIGETRVTCFAQTGSMPVSEGLPYAESYLSAQPVKGTEHTFSPFPAGAGPDTQGKSAASANTAPDQPRFLKSRLTIYPIGHPDAKKVHTIDINEKQTYNGEIVNVFKDIAGLRITRIEVRCSGLATRLSFDGRFSSFTPQDIVQASYDLPASGQSGADYKFGESYFPSSGYDVNTPDAPDDMFTPLKVDTYFYKGNEVIGWFSFDSGHPNGGGIDPPVDENGNPITGPVYLKPGTRLTFTYEGFTIVSIKLSEWGNIDPGGTTPM